MDPISDFHSSLFSYWRAWEKRRELRTKHLISMPGIWISKRRHVKDSTKISRWVLFLTFLLIFDLCQVYAEALKKLTEAEKNLHESVRQAYETEWPDREHVVALSNVSCHLIHSNWSLIFQTLDIQADELEKKVNDELMGSVTAYVGQFTDLKKKVMNDHSISSHYSFLPLRLINEVVSWSTTIMLRTTSIHSRLARRRFALFSFIIDWSLIFKGDADPKVTKAFTELTQAEQLYKEMNKELLEVEYWLITWFYFAIFCTANYLCFRFCQPHTILVSHSLWIRFRLYSILVPLIRRNAPRWDLFPFSSFISVFFQLHKQLVTQLDALGVSMDSLRVARPEGLSTTPQREESPSRSTGSPAVSSRLSITLYLSPFCSQLHLPFLNILLLHPLVLHLRLLLHPLLRKELPL